MTDQEYRAAEGVNKSNLWNLTKSPAHYKYYLENPREDTQSLRYGRAVHAAVLTPTAYKRDFAIMPEGIDRRTSAGKERYNAFMESAAGKEIISAQDAEEIKSIVKAIRSDADVVRLLKGTRREKPLFWTDDNGIRCKCKVDAMKPGIMIDLKTAKDASTVDFTNEAIRYGYHVQAAHYIDGYLHTQKADREPDWYFIVIEKDPPYALNILKADRGFLDYGIRIRNKLIRQLKQCLEKNSFPGYGCNDLVMQK